MYGCKLSSDRQEPNTKPHAIMEQKFQESFHSTVGDNFSMMPFYEGDNCSFSGVGIGGGGSGQARTTSGSHAKNTKGPSLSPSKVFYKHLAKMGRSGLVSSTWSTVVGTEDDLDSEGSPLKRARTAMQVGTSPRENSAPAPKKPKSDPPSNNRSPLGELQSNAMAEGGLLLPSKRKGRHLSGRQVAPIDISGALERAEAAMFAALDERDEAEQQFQQTVLSGDSEAVEAAYRHRKTAREAVQRAAMDFKVLDEAASAYYAACATDATSSTSQPYQEKDKKKSPAEPSCKRSPWNVLRLKAPKPAECGAADGPGMPPVARHSDRKALELGPHSVGDGKATDFHIGEENLMPPMHTVVDGRDSDSRAATSMLEAAQEDFPKEQPAPQADSLPGPASAGDLATSGQRLEAATFKGNTGEGVHATVRDLQGRAGPETAPHPQMEAAGGPSTSKQGADAGPAARAVLDQPVDHGPATRAASEGPVNMGQEGAKSPAKVALDRLLAAEEHERRTFEELMRLIDDYTADDEEIGTAKVTHDEALLQVVKRRDEYKLAKAVERLQSSSEDLGAPAVPPYRGALNLLSEDPLFCCDDIAYPVDDDLVSAESDQNDQETFAAAPSSPTSACFQDPSHAGIGRAIASAATEALDWSCLQQGCTEFEGACCDCDGQQWQQGR